VASTRTSAQASFGYEMNAERLPEIQHVGMVRNVVRGEAMLSRRFPSSRPERTRVALMESPVVRQRAVKERRYKSARRVGRPGGVCVVCAGGEAASQAVRVKRSTALPASRPPA